MLELRMRESELLRVALWVYGAPWLAMLVGTIVGLAVAPGDIGALLGAMAGLSFGVVVLTRRASVLAVPSLEVSAPE
jgi:positive regulator of sigma E activity